MSIRKKLHIDRLSFRGQIFARFFGVVVTLAPFTSYFISTISNDILVNQTNAQGIQVARMLANQSKLALLYESEFTAQESVHFVSGFPDIEVLEIRLADGRSLYQSDSTGGRNLPTIQNDGEDLHSYEFDNEWVYVLSVMSSPDIDDSLDITSLDGSDGPTLLGYVTVSMSKNTLQLLQSNAFFTNLFLSLGMAAIASVLLALLASRITKPIERLAQTMQLAEQGDKGVRAEEKGQPDVTVMQHAFNAMMNVLENREEELELARDKAVENARIKGEFAANVSHELRTPMNAVLGMLDLLDQSKLSTRQTGYVEVAKTSGENLLTLIDDILDFSKMDANKVALIEDNLDLRALLEDVVRLLASQALSKNINIGYLIKPGLPNTVLLDRSRVQQVLINLLGNAIKFTENGDVSVKIKVEGNLNDKKDARLLFEVTDSGIGISENDQKIIFDAFTQADASTTREYAGTGLGLTISKQIVELMNGEIGVNSTINHGTTFWFTLPIEGIGVADNVTMAQTSSQAESAATKRALVISPSLIIQEFTVQALGQKGASCTIAGNFSEAAQLLTDRGEAQRLIDFLIIDEEIYGPNQVIFDTLISTYMDEFSTKAALLVNPFTSSILPPDNFVQIEKPLIRNSYAALYEDKLQDRGHKLLDSDSKVIKDFYKEAKILVVDDNRVNQQVAKEMLAKFGCQTDIADHGEQALEMFVQSSYDLILMDCNMPIMDGYDCTKEIRRIEGKPIIPIVAMTANTTQAEKDKCKQAGMDSFLGKPLRLDSLKAELIDRLPPDILPLNASTQPSKNISVATSASYDSGVVSELFDSIGDVVYRMIEAFIEDTPVYIESMRGALVEENAKQTRELAHTIKGSAANFGAHQLVETAKSIEKFALDEQIDQCNLHISALIEQFSALRKDLENEILKPSMEGTDNQQSIYKLLIVDDDRTIRLALKNIFDSSQFETSEATSGNEAVDICRRHIPDIILMDAIMPDSDGFSACKSIRELPNCADIPILIITSLDDDEAIAEAFSCGATDYITKPLHFTVLKERVSRLVKANNAGKKVKEMAYIDSLTGLPNRARLMQELRVILDRSNLDNKRTAVLFLDLDNFKHINDTLGHNVGDLLLKVVGDRLRSAVRETDFIARLGGDEFTVVLEGVENTEILAHIAQTICDSLDRPFVFLKKKMFVTASVGISIYPDDASDIGTLLKHADLAMFEAKKNKNQFIFYRSGMEDKMSRRLEIEQELRHAIETDQLVLHFQPQYNVKTQKIIGAEALVRWTHPRRGLLMPDEFIPVAEESGLISDLTKWVITEAIKQINTWSNIGQAIKLSVNLSGKDLETSGWLVELLTDLVVQHKIDTSLIELEITEGILMADPELGRRELLKLKKMGFTLAIDDFGTGYSSLNYLKNLPVDILKIDRLFIKDIEQNNDDRAIVKGIIALADSLQMETIAEGVETVAQQDIVSELGCNIIQGYLISKPIPLEEFEQKHITDSVDKKSRPHLRLL